MISAGLFAVMESWLYGGNGNDPWTLVRTTLTQVAGDLTNAPLL